VPDYTRPHPRKPFFTVTTSLTSNSIISTEFLSGNCATWDILVENNTGTYRKDIQNVRREDLLWIHLALYRVQRLALLKKVMTKRNSLKVVNSPDELPSVSV
jgi:hypothetical protein